VPSREDASPPLMAGVVAFDSDLVGVDSDFVGVLAFVVFVLMFGSVSNCGAQFSSASLVGLTMAFLEEERGEHGALSRCGLLVQELDYYQTRWNP
jgi:hypothetical protein